MKRRLLIGRALVHSPQLVLLDEPTVGLDPQVRQELWAMIDALRVEGTSILMTTHYIEEAERLADTVTIVAAGKAVDSGPPAELVARHAGREGREGYGPPDRLNVVEADARAGGFGTRRTGTSVAILNAEGAGDRLPEGEIRAARLEDVFVKLTGEEVA
jgi:lipooligosaccharide transport system ATP-binding protein